MWRRGSVIGSWLLDLTASALRKSPDLAHFAGIVPCGVTAHGVTSLADLGIDVPMAEVDVALKGSFQKIFG